MKKMDIGKNILLELSNYRATNQFDKGYDLCLKYSELPVLMNLDIFKEYFAFFSYYTQHYETSLQMYKAVQYFSQLKEITELCDYNLKFPAQHLIDSYIEYNPSNVEKLNNYFAKQRDNPIITITTTTCKRLDLFKKTINSFIECCLDLTKYEIDKWYVIDDNSSDEDFNEMKRLYPFMTFIRKTKAQKGHARSINMLLKRVKTKYLFNLEDDWQFFHKDTYLTYLLDIINDRDEIKQILLNNTYGEVLDKDALVGGFKYVSKNLGVNYIEHEYASTPEQTAEFNTKWGFKPNCAYWPHFSFRPGLTKTEIFKELGFFKEDVWHFEMNYAYQYVAKGYKTCFLPGLVCKHIGKLTSDKNGINAYVLNDEVQFTGEKKITPIKTLEIKCVNLDRRPERMEKFNERCLNLSSVVDRFSAIDGYNLKTPLHPQLYHLFDKNDYNYRCGIVGCALSHIKILIDYINSDSSKPFLMVMEDDMYFNEKWFKDGYGFEDILEKCLVNMDEQKWDIMCLQYTRRNDTEQNSNKLTFQKVNATSALAYSYGGTGCYVITKEGAKKLLNFINENSMTNAIDTVIQKSADVLSLVYVEPQFIFLDMTTETEKYDTDIQYNYENLNYPLYELIKDEIIWLYDKYNLRINENYTLTTTKNENSVYTYPLLFSWVNLKINPSPAFKLERPNQRLKLDDKFYLSSFS